MDIEVTGFFGLLLLIGDIWAIVNTVGSKQSTPFKKTLWVLFILLLPLVGLIVWFFAGPRQGR